MGRRIAIVALAMAVASALGCAGSSSQASGAVRLQRIMHGLSNPVYLTSPRGDTRLFVVEKCGVIRVDRAGRVLGGRS